MGVKATFYLPAHPAYFECAYTQAEIDSAIERYDRLTRGFIRNGRLSDLAKVECVLLREPGKSVTVLIDRTGCPKERSEPSKQSSFDEFRKHANDELETHVRNIEGYLKEYSQRSGGNWVI